MKGEAFLCDLSCLTNDDYKEVYEPNDDTYLLIDSLNLESRNFLKEFKPKSVLEIGIGSSAVINSFKMMMARDGTAEGVKFVGTDINSKAIECANRVAEKNGNEGMIFLEDQFGTSLSQQGERFDVIIFNPPYVVTTKEELIEAQEKKGIEASCSGGEDGIEVLF